MQQIIELRAEYQNTINSLKLEKVKGTLSRDRIVDVMHEFFNKCAENPHFQVGAGRRRLEAARFALSLYLQKITNEELQKANYNVGTLDANINKKLTKMQKEIKDTIKKYGSPWRTLLNDIASDGGAAFTIITTGLAIGGVVS